MMTYGSSQCLQYMSNEFSFALDLKSDVLLELALTVNLNYTNSHGNMASALHCETKLSLKSPVQYKTLAHYTPFTFIVKSERSEFISQLILVSKKKKNAVLIMYISPQIMVQKMNRFFIIFNFILFSRRCTLLRLKRYSRGQTKLFRFCRSALQRKICLVSLENRSLSKDLVDGEIRFQKKQTH